MRRALLLIVCVLASCGTPAPSQTAAPADSTATAAATELLPPVEGGDPSDKVAAFYYPWYGNPQTDGSWVHWDQSNHQPPRSIGSDYFPALGAYSSHDPAVVAQHMAWLRRAGVGVIAASWWGQGTFEDRAVPLLLEMAERYGIQVAFHIEPYDGRSAASLVRDVRYLYDRYGESPAFFRTTLTSGYSTDDKPRGMFFVWCIEFAGLCGSQPVSAEYWQPAMDEVHALPDGGLVIANTLRGDWIDGGHFDGLYNYITLNLEQEGRFGWARSLPPGALYVPSVMPGNSAVRVGYPAFTHVERRDGSTYDEQWQAALGAGIQPDMLTITSFNEWHEGSMIEPIAIGADDGLGYQYADFGTLAPEGYLDLTHAWIAKYLAAEPPPAPVRARIRIATTSDWTTFNIVSGGTWMRPARVFVSDSATAATFEWGDHFVLMQSLEDAEAGKQVEVVWDLDLTGLDPEQDLVLNIDRGNYGFTEVTVFLRRGSAPVEIKTEHWGRITSGRNSHTFEIRGLELLLPP